MPATPTTAEIKALSAVSLVELAARLGFTFGPSPAGPDRVTVTPPAAPYSAAVLAVNNRLRDPAMSTAVFLAATAAGLNSVAGLKPAAPPPPQKINTKHADGSPISLPPPPEPPPPPAGARLNDPIDAWLSDVDLEQQLHSIATEARFLDERLAALGEPTDDDDHAVYEKRERYSTRLNRITERHRQLREERSRRFDKHVDQVAADRAAGRR